MNYRKVYLEIIKKAKQENRVKGNGIYYEAHHVLPRSIFPLWSKRKSNIVLLTGREHFFCHQLLTKIFPCREMHIALFYMANNSGRLYGHCTSKEYARLRTLVSEERSILCKAMWHNKDFLKKYYETRNTDEYLSRVRKLYDSENWKNFYREEKNKFWSDPEKRKMCVDRMREVLSDPIKRNALIARTKEACCEKVKNIETGIIFNSMLEAAEWAGLAKSSSPKIGMCCRKERACAGKTPNGEKATWEYVGISPRRLNKENKQ